MGGGLDWMGTGKMLQGKTTSAAHFFSTEKSLRSWTALGVREPSAKIHFRRRSVAGL